MTHHYVHQRQLILLVLLWITLISQHTWAQVVPDAQWAKVGRTLAITSDGNIVTTEYVSNPNLIIPGAPGPSGDVLVKYSLQGDQLFRKGLIEVGDYIGGQLQGYNYEVLGGLRIAATTNGRIVLIGGSSLIGRPYIGSVSATGNVGVAPYVDRGQLEKLIGTPDGGFLILTFDNFSKSAYVNKYNINNQREWQKQLMYVAPGSANPDQSLTKARVAIATPDGGYLVGGYFNASGNDTPGLGWVAKLNSEGDVIWQKLLDNPPSRSITGAIPEIVAISSVTDMIVSADGTGYALVGTGVSPENPLATRKTVILELNGDGSGRRSSIIDATATNAYIILYRDSGGRQLYAVGNSSLQNGVDPQILLVDPTPRPLTDPDLLKVIARRTFEAPGDGPLNDIDVAGDGSLVFSTDNNQVVKLMVEPPVTETLQLTQPIYNCQSGFITFNTTGGNGSPITFNAPGISRSSATNNFGTVEEGLRNDPKPITITATQNGQTVSYVFDFGAYCRNLPSPLPPILTRPIPNLTIAVGQSVRFDLGSYFRDPSSSVPGYIVGVSVSVQGLPEGLYIYTRAENNSPIPTVDILGTPSKPGVYTVNVSASTLGGSVRTSFTITIMPDGQPPQPPVGGALALTQPTYNCQTGAITFNTTGGDGSPITYNAPGISRSLLSSNTGTVEQGLRNDPKPITITATQSGNTVSFVFDFKTYCANPQPPQPPQPPTGTTLSLLAPTYDCSSGAITFRTSGGNGSTIEYASAGITGWTTNPNQFVDRDSRTANDVQPFTLMARQNGVTVTYVWNLRAACGRARVGAGEKLASKLTLSVLGNPVSDAATVEIRGAAGKPLTLRLVDMSGKLIEQRVVEQPQETERQRFEVSQPGLLLLRASSGGQSETVKILKQ